MSTEISELIDEAAPAVTGVVRGTRDSQLGAATPCAEFRVRDLLNHLLQVAVNFQALARREDADWAPGPDRLTGDWRETFAADVQRVRAGWSDPDVLDGVSPGMGLPQRVLGLMLVVDLVVHGWDLARATGQDYAVPPRLLAATTEFLGIMAETGRQMGAFGPEVAAPDDAGELERLLALTGRNPRWQP
ncbi:TIGR03086 family metal-binding protein [Actinoplanes sp. OR16]|uniref:TIGR03086 family metal-binding protein n=1 Tax=Actinoplanes sp. OR16 TaxID=946334 RepID=UPI000FDCA96E|nr:TIGR03086 family metal-binding protein [Actinoplanes sp. OR16]